MDPLDPERAVRESPYGTTIAHGFLTVSLLSAAHHTKPSKSRATCKLRVNYGFNRLRFTGAVPVRLPNPRPVHASVH